MPETRTVTNRQNQITTHSYFGVFEVAETASTYRLLVHRNTTEWTVSVAVLNWGTSAEFGSLPIHERMQYSVAEHLVHGNLVDAENLIEIFRCIASDWEV